MDLNKLSVSLDKDKKKFLTKVNGNEAFVKYEMPQEEVLDLKHTFVPEKYRGHGIAKKMAKYALDYAGDNRFTVIPTCNFVKSFLDKNSEYQNLVKED